jgi:hypothetical protein
MKKETRQCLTKVLWRNNPSIQIEKITRRRVMMILASAVLASKLMVLTLNLMAPHAQRLSFSDPLEFRTAEEVRF